MFSLKGVTPHKTSGELEGLRPEGPPNTVILQHLYHNGQPELESFSDRDLVH